MEAADDAEGFNVTIPAEDGDARKPEVAAAARQPGVPRARPRRGSRAEPSGKIDLKLDRTPLARFWPARGPQWDALGRTSRGELLLIEAKAHIPELRSKACAATGKSLSAIRTSIDRAKRATGSRATANWCGEYYQYTNRLAHLHLLRNLNQVPAFLVFVYFLNDTDMSGPRTAEEWAGALRLVHTQLGIDDRRLTKAFGSAVVDVFIDVKDIEAATA